MEGYNFNLGDIFYVDFDGNGIINNGKNILNELGDICIIGNDICRY